MQLTKEKLKQLIKEEYNKLVNEGSDADAVYDYAVDKGAKKGMTDEEIDEILADIESEGSYTGSAIEDAEDRLKDEFGE
jgi:mannitol/fructose-specific phosphotransferase system IIA component (Ntr-type)